VAVCCEEVNEHSEVIKRAGQRDFLDMLRNDELLKY
jgi:hypothetical protein